jgi:hypothetical protein
LGLDKAASRGHDLRNLLLLSLQHAKRRAQGQHVQELRGRAYATRDQRTGLNGSQLNNHFPAITAIVMPYEA